MKAKITSGFTGVISTGSWENARPNYQAEIEVEVDSLDDLIKLQKELDEKEFQLFKLKEEQLIIERIQKERQDFRWYDGKPSVTSIINWDKDFFISPQDLQEYASQGNLYDAQAKHYIKTGVWLPAEEIEGTWSDLVILKKGKLCLPYNDWNFPSFLKKYPIESMEVGEPVISNVYAFGGTPDIRKCYIDGKKTLADIKRTPEKLTHFKQIAGYIIAEEENGESPYEQMALIPANGKTEQGFSKPILSEDIKQYKKMFLKDREIFKKRFGV